MKLVSAGEYLAELNRRLRAHPDYVTGMQFVRQSRGKLQSKASGFDWEPKGHLHPFLEVSNGVRKEFTYPSFDGDAVVPGSTRSPSQASPHLRMESTSDS